MKRHFPDWLAAYQDYTQHSESPHDFHLWTGVSVIAGALRRKVFIDMGYFQWYPNFFLFFVAPPGIVSKSTTADIGMSLLRKVDGIRFGPSSVTWQALVKALSESKEEFPLSNGDYMPMSAITIVASELGTFLDPKNLEMINILVDLWDGKSGSWEKLTKLDGSEVIENPWINLVGCTTTSWIAENFNNYFIGGGFASRTLFVYGDHKRQLVPYPHLLLENDHSDTARLLIEDLEKISLLNGDYQMTAGALDWGTQWYKRHFEQQGGIRADARFGGYFARKQTHIHKTAMIRAASLRNELVITQSDLQWAEKQVTALEKNMVRVFGDMNKEEITTHQANLLLIVKEKGRVKKSEFFSLVMHQIGLETFQLALNGLIEAGLVHMVQYGPSVFIEINKELVEKTITGLNTGSHQTAL